VRDGGERGDGWVVEEQGDRSCNDARWVVCTGVVDTDESIMLPTAEMPMRARRGWRCGRWEGHAPVSKFLSDFMITVWSKENSRLALAH